MKHTRCWQLIVVAALLVLSYAAIVSAPAAARTGAGASAAVQGTSLMSNIQADERVDFFTTSARLAPDGKTWIVPVRGRVYRPISSVTRKALIAQAMKTFGVDPDKDNRLRFDSRIDMLLSDNRGGRQLVVVLAGSAYPLPPSGADGHFAGSLSIPAADLEAHARTGRVAYMARLTERDARTFGGTVLLVPPVGRSIISDIDDTVKVTHVLSTKRLLEATFMHQFEAVPGMARLYQMWATEGAVVHFVSSSPWHFYEPLAVFLQEAGFPPATLALKKIRLKDSSIQNIFADATKTKPPEIEALLKAYPERTFVMVGDSGEKDPEIYADFIRRYPKRIEQIFIRNVTAAKRDDARFSKVFAGIESDRWILFLEPEELPRLLRQP